MNYRDALSIHSKFEGEFFSCDEPIIGELVVHNNSNELVKIEKITVNLEVIHQGKGETDQVILDDLVINDYASIGPDETITHPFEFKPSYNVSFVGLAVTQNISIKTVVDIAPETEKLLRKKALGEKKILSFLGGMFIPDFYDETPVKVVRGETNYEIKKAGGTIRPGVDSAKSIMIYSLIILMVLSLFGYFLSDKQIEVVYVAIALFAVICVVTYVLKIAPSCKINYILKNVEGNFYEAHLELEKGKKLKGMSCRLVGIEEVTYDCGSSRCTSSETFHESVPTNVQQSSENTFNEVIALPEISVPISISNNDFDIIWKFEITMTTANGSALKGSAPIELGFEKERIKNPNSKNDNHFF